MKFQKKPVVIEAVLWTGDNYDEVREFVGEASNIMHPGDRTLIITTLEGNMRADPGDWIIRGIEGEYYPCKPEIFAKTYDEVPEFKPTILLDFDGVVHLYSTPWEGVDVIPDDPTFGAFAFIDAAIAAGFDVQIYSSRSQDPDGLNAMREWFSAHGRPDLAYGTPGCPPLSFPTQKPPAFLTIDDRALCFEGEFPDPEQLRDFVPWNRR